MSYYIAHSGTKGMKWGVRKYQNEDGSLTPAGRERYKNMMPASARAAQQKAAQEKAAKAPKGKTLSYMDVRYKNMMPSSAQDAKLKAKYDQDKIDRKNKFKNRYKDVIDRNRPTEGSDIWHGPAETYDEYLDMLLDKYSPGQDFDYDEEINNAIRDANHRIIFDGRSDTERFESDPQTANMLTDARIAAVTTLYELTPTYKKRKNEAEAVRNAKRNSANNMGKGSMPTSAITAKKKAEYESLVKSKIPASAWNQRVKGT